MDGINPLGPLDLYSLSLLNKLCSSTQPTNTNINTTASNLNVFSFNKEQKKLSLLNTHFNTTHSPLPSLSKNTSTLSEIFKVRFCNAELNASFYQSLSAAYLDLYFGTDIAISSPLIPVLPQPIPLSGCSSLARDKLCDLLNSFTDPLITQSYYRLGIHQPRGILISGIKGSGKSFLLHHISQHLLHHSNAAVYFVTAASMLSKYFGETERNVRMMFQQGRLAALERPVVIVMDELMDVLCGKRGVDSASFESRVLSMFLNELDGIEETSGKLLIIATTSNWQALDDAVKRPGRFDVIVDSSEGFDTGKFVEEYVRLMQSKSEKAEFVMERLRQYKSELSFVKTPAEAKRIIHEAVIDEILTAAHSFKGIKNVDVSD